jgi:hypothetical protein
MKISLLLSLSLSLSLFNELLWLIVELNSQYCLPMWLLTLLTHKSLPSESLSFHILLHYSLWFSKAVLV